MKTKQKAILWVIIVCTVIGIFSAVIFLVQADDRQRPSDLREATPATYVDEQADQTKTVSGFGEKEKELTYDSTVDRNGKKDLYLDDDRNKYYYNENGELESYLHIWPDAEPQKGEAAAVLDEKPTAESKKEPAAVADPSALKIPEEMRKTMNEDALRIVTLAWKKGLELYGDRISGFELQSYRISADTGSHSQITFARKYGADNSIYGQFLSIEYDWYGTLKMAFLLEDTFEEADAALLADYTEDSLVKMAHDRLMAEPKGSYDSFKTSSYSFKIARLRRLDDGKVYLMVGLRIMRDETSPEASYITYFEL